MTVRSVLRHRVALLVVALIAVACVISSTTRARSVSKGEALISTPVKAHLVDGSIVVFARGVSLGFGQIVGVGTRYDPTLRAGVPVQRVALDSVVGVETYERQINPGRTLVYSTVTGAATVVATAALLVAIFGSCPTIYADSAGTMTLQAESFSYSIAPLLEKRDVDRLRLVADAAGVVRLDVRNEALESHYIDHLELLEATHRRDELVVPAPRAGLVALRMPHAPAEIRDRAGRDLRDVLDRPDNKVFATDSTTLARAAAGGAADDYIDLVVPKPQGRDSLAIVLRMRSSLLTTMFFYDRMLAGQGASALEYVGRDLQRVTKVAQLATWYVRHFGLRVSVMTDGGREELPVARLVDFGPAAWRDVAVIVPSRADGDSVHIRLTFLADAFRIDQVRVSSDIRTVAPRTLSVARVTDGSGSVRGDVRDVLQRADDRRLQTWPGQRFIAEFDVGVAPAMERTFFLAAQGYYVEWMRANWLKTPVGTAFAPWDEPVAPILRRWLSTRDSLEQRFFLQRVPIV